MLTTPILTLAPWSTMISDVGVFTAEGMDLDRDIYIYYPVWSPSARKNIETNLDVPNPEALTFLDISGSGSITVTINGLAHTPVPLETEDVTISDIALEIGGNHVLVQWQPDKTSAVLKMRWRNIMHLPEVGLTFGEGGSAN
jgi:hypothetical protein